MAIFADRAAAGQDLARHLEHWRGADAVIFGIPRGGVVVAAEVARILELPLDVAIVRKLGAPSHQEFAVGAIADGVRVVNADAVRDEYVTTEQLAFIEDMERVELKRRAQLFGSAHERLRGRVAIVVDDGIATGATAWAACHSLRARDPVRMVLAVPVAPAEWRPDSATVDEYVCSVASEQFWAVGQFYDDFTQTTDEEVVRLLARDLPR